MGSGDRAAPAKGKGWNAFRERPQVTNDALLITRWLQLHQTPCGKVRISGAQRLQTVLLAALHEKRRYSPGHTGAIADVLSASSPPSYSIFGSNCTRYFMFCCLSAPSLRYPSGSFCVRFHAFARDDAIDKGGYFFLGTEWTRDRIPYGW